MRDAASRIEPRVSFPEARAGGIYSDGWQAGSILGGAIGAGSSPVAVGQAEALSAVTSCVELISGTLASLPAYVYVQTDQGREEAAPTHPVARLIRRPNGWMSWPAWMQNAVASILLHGNAVSWVRLDGRGAPTALIPVPWSWLLPQVLPSGRLVFDVLHATPEARLMGLPARLLDTDVLHVKARSDVGIIGRSVLSRAASVIREGIDTSTLASSNWRNGMRPGGILTRDKFLTDTQRDQLDARVRDFSGPGNAGKTMILEGGWTWTALGLNSSDAELLASRQFNAAEIASLFNVPLQLIRPGDKVVPTLAPYMTALAQMALAPIVAAIEAEFSNSVFVSDAHSLGIDMGGLTRGDFATRWSAYAVAAQNSLLTRDEIREAEGYGPHPDGPEPAPAATEGSPIVPTGTVHPPDLPGLPSTAPKPGKTGDGLPAPGTNGGEGHA